MTPGFIYLARLTDAIVSGVRGPVKIGKTENVEERKKDYAGYPSKVVFAHVIETNEITGAEALLHKRYNPQRMQGEWFALGEADIADLRRIKVLDCEPPPGSYLPDWFLAPKPLVFQRSLYVHDPIAPADGYEAGLFLEAAGWTLIYSWPEHPLPLFEVRSPVLVVARSGGNVICAGGHTREVAVKNAWLRVASLGMAAGQSSLPESD